MLLYISIPPNLCQNVSGSSTISFYLRRPPRPYYPSPSNSNSPPPVSFLTSMATCPSLIPMISREGCYHHRLDRRITSVRSSAKYKSMIGRASMYCVAVFWWWRYIPQSIPIPPFPALLQWVGAPTSYPADVWGPYLPSAVPPSGETPRWPSTTGGSLPTSRTQTGAPLAPPPHRTSPLFSYTLPPVPRYSSSVPIFTSTSGGYIPLPTNRRQWTTTFVPGIGMKRPLSAVYHTPRRLAPSITPSPRPETSFTSSLYRSSTLLRSFVSN